MVRVNCYMLAKNLKIVTQSSVTRRASLLKALKKHAITSSLFEGFQKPINLNRRSLLCMTQSGDFSGRLVSVLRKSEMTFLRQFLKIFLNGKKKWTVGDIIWLMLLRQQLRCVLLDSAYQETHSQIK